MGPGIERVYAVRYSDVDEPVLLLCRANGSYVNLLPAQKHGHKFTCGAGVQWRDDLQILNGAAYISVSWLQIVFEAYGHGRAMLKAAVDRLPQRFLGYPPGVV